MSKLSGHGYQIKRKKKKENKIIFTGFVYITAKKVGFFVLERNFFLRFDKSYNLENIKSLFGSYWPLIYIIFYFIFQTYDLKPTLC